MNTLDVKVGMTVEYHMSPAQVIKVNRKSETAVIQRCSDNQQMSVPMSGLSQDHHQDPEINMYYWGC